MLVSERTAGDIIRLKDLARTERRAEQKDRLMVVSHALAGMETLSIQAALCRSRGFVQRWVYAYRDGGIEALIDKRKGGSRPKFPRQREPELMARLDAGPTAADGVCTLRGKDVTRIAQTEFGVKISLNGAYRLLKRMNYSCLKPRPRHENADPQAVAKFKEHAPLLSRR